MFWPLLAIKPADAVEPGRFVLNDGRPHLLAAIGQPAVYRVCVTQAENKDAHVRFYETELPNGFVLAVGGCRDQLVRKDLWVRYEPSGGTTVHGTFDLIHLPTPVPLNAGPRRNSRRGI